MNTTTVPNTADTIQAIATACDEQAGKCRALRATFGAMTDEDFWQAINPQMSSNAAAIEKMVDACNDVRELTSYIMGRVLAESQPNTD